MKTVATTLNAKGYRVRFVERGPERLVTEWEVDSYSGPPLHWHPAMREGWEVLAGTMTVEVDGVLRELGVGDAAVAEPGAHHRFTATGPVSWRQTNEPALRHERLFRVDHRRARRRGVAGRAGPIEAVRIFALFDGYLEGPPILLQRLVRAICSAVDRLAGPDA